ncbi:MAG: hypothetical protein AB7L66_04475 [Gemmatimonadales bacterium]
MICQDDRPFAPGDLLRTAIEIDETLLRDAVAGDVEGLTYRLVRALTGVYWGSGCQVIGKGAFELRTAVGAAVALSWARRNSPRRFDETWAAYRRIGSWSRPDDIMAALTGAPMLGSAARLAVRLAEVLAGTDGERTLRQATRDFWGVQAPPRTILTSGFGIA